MTGYYDLAERWYMAAFDAAEEYLKSRDRLFRVKCTVCGKLGKRRKTMHGAKIAWNEMIWEESI